MQRADAMTFSAEEPHGTSWSFGTSWVFGVLPGKLVAIVMAVVLATSLAMAPGQQQATEQVVASAEEAVQVIVRAVAGSEDAERSIEQLGGTVVQRLGLVDGLVVEIAASQVPALSSVPGILSVTNNGQVRLFSKRSEGDAIVGAAVLGHVRKVTGSTVSDRRGFDGTGIGVGVVDTGAATVTGLPKLHRGPSVGGGTSEDGYGHGTHLAGIISGNDGLGTEGFLGVSPESTPVSVKAAADDGSTSLAAVIAALDWVAQHKDSKNIRVLNLSLGVTPLDDYRKDILALAVERLWKAGVVVVVAAGNEGEKPGSPITSPAYDPFVIAVGSVDTKDTEVLTDDVVQPFSPRGSAARRVDLVAPGQSLVSLRAPGSYAEKEFPAAHVGDRFIKGTGTSQAAAVVSALAADLIEQRPELTPDQVKALLKMSASSLSATDADGQGSGLANLRKALATATPTNATQTWAPAGVTPTLAPPVPIPPPAEGDPYCEYDVSLGPPEPPAPPAAEEPASTDATATDTTATDTTATDTTATDTTVTAQAVEDTSASAGMCGWSGGSWSADGTTFTGGSWSGGSWSGGSWSGGSWSGGSWSGGSWSGGSWSGGSWSGGSWSAGTWTGGSWSGGSWSGGSWSGGSWSGGSWSGGSWSGGSWSGGSWSGGSWSGGSWSGGSWSGGSWSGGSWSGGSWSGGSWSGGSWSGGSWSGGSWSGGSWSGGSWSGGSWSGGSWSGGSWSGGSWSGGSWSGGSWSGGSWSGGSWSGGSWSGGSWSGGSWSGSAWTGTSWS